jgi:hypothetical protein
MFGQVKQNEREASRMVSKSAVVTRLQSEGCRGNLAINNWPRNKNHCSCFVKDRQFLCELHLHLFSRVSRLDICYLCRDETSVALNSSRLMFRCRPTFQIIVIPSSPGSESSKNAS